MDNNKSKETDIKSRTCCYCDNIIKINDIAHDNILLNKKSYKPFLIYDVAYKTPYGSKP